MTSGVFHSVPLDTIKVDRDARQRREITKVDELADSISRLGLINPLVITRDIFLVAGERRLEACRSLGWSHVSCQYVDELDAHMLRAIELEENIKRIDLPWQDQCLALHEYHALRLNNDPDWDQNRTADAIGLAPQTVSAQLKVADQLLRGNPRIVEAKKYSSAKTIIHRDANRNLASTKEAIYRSAEAMPGFDILQTDFLRWAPAYEGPRFNFIHCDFPYGIGADKFNQGSAETHGGYRDTPETYFNLIGCLNQNIDRLATDSCHLIFWFSMETYQPTKELLSAGGWTVHAHPLIWYKSDNTGILPDPMRGPRRVYETAFFGSRGDRHIVHPVANLCPAPAVSGRHMSEKNEEMLRFFFRMVVDDTTHMLDPTCGSGSAIRAASGTAKSALGLEIDEEFYAIALAELRRRQSSK